MKRVLFVDAEPKVLDGLRRLLHPMGSEWEMTFVGSGSKALSQLAANPFDVVVTDIRMPEMDGVELLERVSRQYPRVVRIVLSGQADDETSMRVVDLAHQCLAKPCDPDILKRALNRSCALRDIVGDPTIQALLARIDHLPSMPGILVELVREIRSPQASFQKVATIMTKDVGMTSKILQLVNSAFFGLR